VSSKGGIGCLRDYRLRYGDLNLDGKTELILLLGGGTMQNDFVIFSLDTHTIVFSALLLVEDLLPSVDAAYIYQETKQTPVSSDPQFWSALGVNYAHRMHEIKPALLSYAKLYFGDFNDDNQFDIILWRKQYESRMRGDPVKGFELKSEIRVMYTLKNGEYKKQPFDNNTIETWLSGKNQTWKKGYPNQSECVGEEGQLIKSLHDPLLNDPDVLK